MLPGFTHRRVAVTGAELNVAVGGSGPPLLLLHGYPQTHVMWHRVAPALAERHTVVAPDLRGYGDSSRPPGGEDHSGYSKRAMARDNVELMAALGFPRFRVAGHDRGGRAAHRMALDHPDAVAALAVLDIVPTHHLFRTTDEWFARSYYHWFFLAQPHPMPERLIGGDPVFYLRHTMRSWARVPDPFHPAAMAEYERCFSDPEVIHPSCEDYRAGATIDLEHDEEDLDRKLTAPLLALWGGLGRVGTSYDVPATWRARAADVRGEALPCGHFVPEEAPAETIRALTGFFGEVAP